MLGFEGGVMLGSRWPRHGFGLSVMAAAVVTAVACMGVLTPVPAGAATPHSSGDRGPGTVSAYRQNNRHDGVASGPALPASLRQAWRRSFPGPVSYAVAADHRVFVVSVPDAGTRAGQVYALDAKDGHVLWGPVYVGDDTATPSLTYSNGTLVALSGDGDVFGLDPATGARRWQKTLRGRQGVFWHPPTPFQGRIYISGAGLGGSLFCLDVVTGRLLWSSDALFNAATSVAVDSSGVYAPTNGYYLYHFNLDGRLTWQAYYTQAASIGGQTTVLHGDAVWTHDTATSGAKDLGAVVSTTNGAMMRHYDSVVLPAISRSTALLVDTGTDGKSRVRAVSSATGKTLWTQRADGQIDTPAVVSGARAYFGSASGRIFGLNMSTGAVVWKASAGNPVLGPQEWGSKVRAGLSIGEQILFVPAGNTLVAYR